VSQIRDEHFRVGVIGDGMTRLQPEHFTSRKHAQAYIDKWRGSGWVGDDEVVVIVIDYDSRVYPAWRPNRPSQPSPMFASVGSDTERGETT